MCKINGSGVGTISDELISCSELQLNKDSCSIATIKYVVLMTLQNKHGLSKPNTV